jgi:guanylate kinase
MNQIGKLILVCGKSGSGKTTLINNLLLLYPNLYCRPLSYTTRTKRADETDSEYIFTTQQNIASLWEQNKLINLDFIYGNYYGIIKSDLDQKMRLGKNVIKEVHPQNINQFLDLYPNTILVSILCNHSNATRSPERKVADDDFYQHDCTTYNIIYENNFY